MKNRAPWTYQEKRKLMEYVQQAPTVKAGIERFAQESGRTAAACSFMYYQLTKQEHAALVKSVETLESDILDALYESI